MSLETVGGMCMYTHKANHKDTTTTLSGHQKIAWASNHMPIMTQLIKDYCPLQPLSGYTIVTSVHLEAKTAFLVQTLAKLGATVYATGCNPLSTQDDVASALDETPYVTVYAKHGCNDFEYWSFLEKALGHYPHIIIDDGGDLIKLIHESKHNDYNKRLIGGCEETTTGIFRLKYLTSQRKLQVPMINVNDADCKHLFDNYYGTGQSVLDGIIRTTNLIIAGKTVVVAGYGDCGSGIAKRMRGLDAHVIVTEINPVKALKAHMDGFMVMPMLEAAKVGDVFITATGCKDVITSEHFKVMKDGAIMANAGHFNVEINLNQLEQYATEKNIKRQNIIGYHITEPNKTLYVLAEGRLVNLAAADGHAAEIMDMSFSIQLLSVIHIAQNFDANTAKVLHSVPRYIDQTVAKYALTANNVAIDTLTKEQETYLKNGF